jgi:hypothetical protein
MFFFCVISWFLYVICRYNYYYSVLFTFSDIMFLWVLLVLLVLFV